MFDNRDAGDDPDERLDQDDGFGARNRGASGDLASLGLGPGDDGARRAGPSRGVVVVLLAGALVAGLALWFVVTALVAEREKALAQSIESRLTALAEGRAEVAATWIDGLEATAGRLVGSELIRLFLAENNVAAVEELAPALQAQRPYMQDALASFARRNGFAGAALHSRDGRLALGWGETAPSAFVESARREILDGATRVVSRWSEDLNVSIALPIAAPQSENEALAGFMTFDVRIAERAAALLARSALGRREESAFLAADDAPVLGAASEGGVEAFDARPPARVTPGEPSLDGTAPQGVYVERADVRGAPWTIVQEADWEIARAPLDEFRARATLAALAAAALMAMLAFAFFRHQAAEKQAALASQYRDLASRIESQRRLLDAVTGAALDGIALRSEDGVYVYANPAFAAALGATPERVVGASDHELIGAAAASDLAGPLSEALAGEPVTFVDKPVRLPFGERVLSGSAAPLPVSASGLNSAGLVLVLRDVTEQVEERRRRERMVEQMVDAFVHTIEMSDPYLVGHTNRMRALAREVGGELGFSEHDCWLLSLAAGLSQLGKTFVPPEIVRKPGRHTPEETALMRKHVELGLEVLKDIDLDPKVIEAYGAMHERLDGSGYPNGLAGDQIGKMARVLGCIDVFCARTQPRSYREHIDDMEAIAWLRANSGRYDVTVVEALGRVAASRTSENADA